MRRNPRMARLSFMVMLSATAMPLPGRQVPYGTGSWDTDTLGNHRAVLKVAEKADAVQAHIPWRRRDAEPEKINIIVIEESTGRKVTNLLRLNVNRTYGDIMFQAQNPGTYYVYYLPYVSKGRNYPVVTYQAPEENADPAWLKRVLASPLRSDVKPQQAALVEIQACDEFNSFYPMEVIASPEEVAQLLAAHPGSRFLLFPEDRSRPIRMTGDLPQKWIIEGPRTDLAGEAARGEYYTFQVGLYAAADIANLRVRFEDLLAVRGRQAIPSAAFNCFNTGGIDWDGGAFRKVVPVKKGQVQALWFGVQIPREVAAGLYRGRVTIEPDDMPAQSVNLAITVNQSVIANAGDDEPWRHSRLRWLDSQRAVDYEVVRPFVPVRLVQNTIHILGRRLTLGARGFPAQIESYFTPEVTQIQKTARPLLTAPMELVVEEPNGEPAKWAEGAPRIMKRYDGVVEWQGSSISLSLKMQVIAALEFDGFVQYQVTLSASRPVAVRDIRLEIPLAKEAVPYMMGLGLRGGYRPADLAWSWDVKKNQDGAWLGDANAGLQFSLRAQNYARPLNTNFYQSKPLNMPPSWFNEGKGGITVRAVDDATVMISCFSGSRTIRPGQDLHFDFNLLLTPFKPLDTKSQWSTRFFHAFKPVDEAIRAGANTINVHHANDVNPYINYPFIHQAQMKAYIDEAHRKGLKVKIYNTIRELSNRAPELFALRSLGSEVFTPGPGGGFSWLQEHLGSNYIAAWFVPQLKDAAIINSGMSRWHNYYIEGLNWLVRNMQIDGLYIDDVAFDRTTMKRVRKVLDQGRPEAVIDLHSANQYNPRDGFTNSANLYLEHFPYVNRLWFGEYFDPNSPPDFWFIEMSGIPYGLMGEMLQDGGNRWRGMIYGMTSRMPYGGNDPGPIWKVWDDFRIQESDMIGYWSPRCPVKTGRKDVLATAYVAKGRTLVSIASWAAEDVSVRLTVDWGALGIQPTAARLRGTEIRDFQPAAEFKPTDPIPVPKGKGWLLIIEPQAAD